MARLSRFTIPLTDIDVVKRDRAQWSIATGIELLGRVKGGDDSRVNRSDLKWSATIVLSPPRLKTLLFPLFYLTHQ